MRTNVLLLALVCGSCTDPAADLGLDLAEPGPDLGAVGMSPQEALLNARVEAALAEDIDASLALYDAPFYILSASGKNLKETLDLTQLKERLQKIYSDCDFSAEKAAGKKSVVWSGVTATPFALPLDARTGDLKVIAEGPIRFGTCASTPSGYRLDGAWGAVTRKTASGWKLKASFDGFGL